MDQSTNTVDQSTDLEESREHIFISRLTKLTSRLTQKNSREHISISRPGQIHQSTRATPSVDQGNSISRPEGLVSRLELPQVDQWTVVSRLRAFISRPEAPSVDHWATISRPVSNPKSSQQLLNGSILEVAYKRGPSQSVEKSNQTTHKKQTSKVIPHLILSRAFKEEKEEESILTPKRSKELPLHPQGFIPREDWSVPLIQLKQGVSIKVHLRRSLLNGGTSNLLFFNLLKSCICEYLVSSAHLRGCSWFVNSYTQTLPWER